jgi:hypothetical protein
MEVTSKVKQPKQLINLDSIQYLESKQECQKMLANLESSLASVVGRIEILKGKHQLINKNDLEAKTASQELITSAIGFRTAIEKLIPHVHAKYEELSALECYTPGKIDVKGVGMIGKLFGKRGK